MTGEYIGDVLGEADKTESAIDTSTNVLDSELQYAADDAAEQDDEDESSGDVRSLVPSSYCTTVRWQGLASILTT